ncbi:MAG: O-antigen ligase family protein, partial [Pseudomonadota bacterium]
LDWDVRGIVHGHNSWLDLAVGFGLPGALVLSMFIVVLPLRDYLAIPRVGMPKRLATLFISLWVLTALGASLESFFFRRADPVWFLMLIAIMGLRITAHRTRELR